MWKPFLKVIRECAPNALSVLERFPILVHFSKAIDQVRAEESRKLARSGKGEVLKKFRWAILKRPENLTESQELKDLPRINLKTVKAYLLKEEFQKIWHYSSPFWAERCIRKKVTAILRSRIESMKKVARMIRRHESLILKWFRSKSEISDGTVEGLNGRGRVVTKRAYGFRSFRALEVAFYHDLGRLSVPKFTHRFW